MAQTNEHITDESNQSFTSDDTSQIITTNETSNEDTESTFEQNNARILSSCEWLRKLEIKFKQTIEINPSEKENPNGIIDYLDYISQNYGLRLDKGSSSNFFVPTQPDELSFEEVLTNKFQHLTFKKALLRCYHYLVLFNRKSMFFNFKDVDNAYNFDLRDIHHVGGISPMCFDALNDIPSNIVKRCKVSYENYQVKTRSFVRKLESYHNQIYSKQVQMQNVAQSDDGDNDKKQQQINSINNEIKAVERKVEKLSFEIEEELYVTPRTETPTPDEIIQFIADFVCYGLNVTKDVINNTTFNQIYKNNGITYTRNKDVIQSLNIDELYFQDDVNYCWVASRDLIQHFVTKLSPTFKTNQEGIQSILKGLSDTIKAKSKVALFHFKEDTLFFKNGMIEMTYQDKGHIDYQFTHNNLLNRHKLMFDYATKLRLNIIYDDTVSFTFQDNIENEPVTPDYIFGALGRRGFETNEDTDEETKQALDDEAHGRANLLMQQVLKVLMPYNDLPVLNETFLYFYNSANSGKSTYMDLMNYMVGNDLTTNLSIKDLSSKESFGLINTKDKRLALIDEATDGKSKIDTENIKKITSKSRIDANAKNKDYIDFKPEVELIFASNYEPTFLDESGGTERRLLAFQLETGYAHNGNSNAQKDLTFIKQDLIKRNDFKSACVKWVLENVNINQPIPKSIQDNASDLISKEDDVKSFINEKVQQQLDEPTVVYPDDLYELYKIESISKGRNPSKIRNKSNFKKAIAKMNQGIYLVKDVNHSKLDVLNQLISLEGRLFSEIHIAQNNHALDNTLIKHFMDIMTSREQELKRFFGGIEAVEQKKKRLADLTAGKKQTYIILPDLPQYEGMQSEADLRSIVTNQKHRMLKNALTDTNMQRIKASNLEQLPTPIRPNLTHKFYAYTNDYAEKDKFKFEDFTKYNG